MIIFKHSLNIDKIKANNYNIKWLPSYKDTVLIVRAKCISAYIVK